MEPQQYQNIFQYLTSQIIPIDLVIPYQKQKFINFCSTFQINNQFLYKVHSSTNQLLRVIQKKEMEAILYMMHSDPTGGHLATEAMFSKIRT